MREKLLPYRAVIVHSGAAPATRAEYERLSADEQTRIAVDALERLTALAELALGLIVALELVIPAARSFISAIAYWQYLQMRVVLERQSRGGPTLHAFGLLDARLLALSARSKLLKGGYERLRAILAVMSSPPQPLPGGPPPAGAPAPARPRRGDVRTREGSRARAPGSPALARKGPTDPDYGGGLSRASSRAVSSHLRRKSSSAARASKSTPSASASAGPRNRASGSRT